MIMGQNLIDVFDPDSALARVGGDQEFLYEIAGLVRAAWPSLLEDIRTDLGARDFFAVEADARLARAAAIYVSARKAQDAALQLQSMAVEADLPGALRASAKLEEEVGKLQLVLTNFRQPKNLPLPSVGLAFAQEL